MKNIIAIGLVSTLGLTGCMTTGSNPYSPYGGGNIQYLTPGEESNSAIQKACAVNHQVGLAIFGAVAGALLSDDPAVGAAIGGTLGHGLGTSLDNASCNTAKKAAKLAMNNAGTKYTWKTAKSHGYSVVNSRTHQRKDVIWVNGVEKVSYTSVSRLSSGRWVSKS